jgi:hypothetical protein
VRSLCIVDTCSLVYLSEITVANRPLHRWLWDEFKVFYSAAVWDEIQRHLTKMGRDARSIKKDGQRYKWPLPTIVTCERALFAQPFERELETGFCRQCRRPKLAKRSFAPDLDIEENKGERHNCCVALDAVMKGDYRQVIFLTDDYKAVRDYAGPVFEVFPLGHIWSSYDFVLYLFVRHRQRFPRAEAEAVLRDITARAAGSGVADHSQQAQEQWMRRLGTYHRKVDKIDRVLNQIGGRP